MNATTKMSAKGQVVIPKDVRDALGLQPGQVLDVKQTASGVLLSVAHRKSGRSTDEIFAELRKIYTHSGPPATIEQMDAAVDSMFAAKSKDDI
ncbi:AbrB/MazE/SpoVT family DNA-binding domain-containing protein [Sphingomonas sp.]|jgi:AbrB family looped-hinge helix DNA binding protein|uniref:AbrB/MazE/SpoVT family DNA-binding domain-containing protein n=1 Tax=Sphingomonas sp. TaxID=28214 RepID=UPI002E339377|nr:AbrB/MazE/SpoVT family DNA-binding domain-containing protein [Sphingomonas sp.]HEX4694197.1 AbrB/MazE/SpoVT family DNA-binding domain-containing protein [Sphingomonas sp.]